MYPSQFVTTRTSAGQLGCPFVVEDPMTSGIVISDTFTTLSLVAAVIEIVPSPQEVWSPVGHPLH
jgi:hypothetical protein